MYKEIVLYKIERYGKCEVMNAGINKKKQLLNEKQMIN